MVLQADVMLVPSGIRCFNHEGSMVLMQAMILLLSGCRCFFGLVGPIVIPMTHHPMHVHRLSV